MSGENDNVEVGITVTTDQLASGMGQAEHITSEAAAAMQESLSGIGEALTKTAELFGVAFTADKFKEWIGGALEAAEQAEHLSLSLGVTTQTIQTLSYAAGLTGSSLETASSALVRLERSASLAQDSTTKQADAFRSLGISSAQLAELLKNPDELLKTVTSDLAQFTSGADKNRLGIELMGRSFATNAALFKELGLNYGELEQHAKDLGLVLSDTDEHALADAQRGFNDLGQQVKGLGNEMAIALLPAINSVRGAMADVLSSDGFKNFLTGAATNFNQLIVMFGQLKSVIVDTLHIDLGNLGWNDLAGDVATVGKLFVNLENIVADVWSRLGLVMDDTWTGLKNDVKDAVSVAEADLAGLFDKLSAGLSVLSPDAALAAKGIAASLMEAAASVTYATVDVGKYSDAIQQNAQRAYEDKIAIDQWAQGTRDSATALGTAGAAADDAGKKILDLSGNAKKAAEDAASLRDELTKWAEQMDALAAKSSGPYDAAALQFLGTMTRLDDELVKMIGHGLTLAQAEEMDAHATDLATAAMNKQIAVDLTKNDLADTWIQKLRDQVTALGAISDAEKAAAEFDALATKNLLLNRDAQGQWYETAQEAIDANNKMRQGYIDAGAALLQNSEDLKQSQALLKSWASTAQSDFTSTFASIEHDIEHGGSVMKDLVNLAETVVNQIIAEFAKLAVIDPLLNSIFGLSGAGAFPTLNTALGALSQSGFGGGGASAIAGGQQVISGGNWLSSLLGGSSAASGVGTIAGAGVGPSALMGPGSDLAPDFMGPPMELQGSPGLLDSFGGLTGALTLAGGAFAAFNEFQAAGGGAAGLAGAAAYGLGAITAAGAITGALTGVGAAAGAAGALGTVGLAAVPVVGWIALGAMALNMLTGGGLFGTSYKPTGASETDISISDSGGSLSESYQESKKKALFGGTKYKNVNVTPTADQSGSIETEADTIKAGAQAFAEQFGQTLDTFVGGVYKISVDKHKKETDTDTVLGKTYTGETQQQFAERLQADNYLAVLDKMGLGASEFVAGLQGNADKLAAGVNDFAGAAQAANTNLGAGFRFLSLGADQTLIDVMKFVEGMQQGGETLEQTYSRLAAAQQKYDQFTAQFKPATQYVDDYESGLSKIYHAMLNNIAAANAYAQAAGADGAAQSDLTNIQSAAADQMAALTAQLEVSAQGLAFSLGVTLFGSLSQVTNEINSIIAAAKKTPTSAAADIAKPAVTATSALNDFGGAITSVANSASAATNLLLGALSPLNDQQKLQIAMQGLQAGTVTQEQVLTIGRQLYASSEAYTTLFNQVMQYGDRGGAGVSGGGGGSGGGSIGSLPLYQSAAAASAPPPPAAGPPTGWTGTTDQWNQTGLTVAQWGAMSHDDQQKLLTLLQEQSTLQAAKTTQDFQTLAQQIAEIAAAKGETFQQILDEMGIKNADIEKGLGIKSDADLQAYMDKLQKQLDSAKENTQSIVTAISMLPQQIADAINGKPGMAVVGLPQPAPVTPAPSGGDGGGSGGSGGGTGGGGGRYAPLPRGAAPEDYAAFGKAVGEAVGRKLAPFAGNMVRSER